MTENQIELYDDLDKSIMVSAAKSYNIKDNNRVQQIIAFAKDRGYKKLGITTCIALKKEAEKLMEILKNAGFEVAMMHCREEALKKSDYAEDLEGSSCNPAAQAKKMNDENVDFVITMGLCLGHDLVFQKHCKLPKTNLIVKDFTNNHKTIELLH